MSSLDSTMCPVTRTDELCVTLAHGEGARLSRKLIHDVFVRAFAELGLQAATDGAILPTPDSSLIMSTDSFVVTPLFFPGGDIGSLSIHGTINDLAVMGAMPLYVAAAFIIEEGLPIETLRRIIRSMAAAAFESRVSIVTGDTKVVPRGAADRIFITTTGIGCRFAEHPLGPQSVQIGDRLLINGTIGDHGLTILAAREEFAFSGGFQSDSTPLHDLVRTILKNGIAVRWMRDPTRGGVSAVLHELAEIAQVTIEIEENALPVHPGVRGACEVLGLDPLFVANEGKLIMVVADSDANRLLELLRDHPLGWQAAMIGQVVDSGRAEVVSRTAYGQIRVLDEPQGALLPRIC